MVLKRYFITLIILLFICKSASAHGIGELVFGIPLMFYFVILPPFIGMADYHFMAKEFGAENINKKSLWRQNYLSVMLAYFVMYKITSSSDELSDFLFVFCGLLTLLTFQIFIKSVIYKITRVNKSISVIRIIKSIYLTNILFIASTSIVSLIIYILNS